MKPAAIPEGLRAHPRLDQWLTLAPDGVIRAMSGKVDIGQGISHALRLIVAEELQVAPLWVDMVPPSTRHSPDEGVTSGSLSVQHSGAALRFAAAHLREACRARFAQRLGVPPAVVTLAGGVFRAHGECAGYGELADAALLDAAVDTSHLAPRGGRASTTGAPGRSDVAEKVFGQFQYIQDLAPAGMVHGAIFRPRTLQAQVHEDAWRRLLPRLEAVEGVSQVVRDGLLVGVLAEGEHALAQVAERVELAGLWQGETDVPQPHDIAGWLRSQPLDSVVIQQRQDAAPAAARTFRAEYGRGWLQHASIGLCCALAQWTGGALQVWSHTQGIFNLRRDLALAFGLPADAVTVSHAEGAGCYGHNGADDVAFDAAWLARHAGGRPVRLQWTRQQEMANAPLAPAMAVRVEASVDAEGRLVAWRQDVWSQGHGTRPGRGATPALLGAWQLAEPAPVPMAVNQPPATGGGSDRNAVPPYAVPRLDVHNHRVLAMPLRVSAMRALGAHVNVLAAESMMDEIAHALARDPLAYRLEHLDHDERARAVLLEAARMARWPEAGPREPGVGRGLGFARYKNTGAYCAVVAEVEVLQQARVRRLWIAADLGLVVHPDGARNQVEGGAIQAASWTLREQADLGPEGVRSRDWATYPIHRFTDVPTVDVALVDRPDSPSLGAGECSVGPTAAAIANAIHDALGIRMRVMPFTADNLMREAQQQGA
ncbi:MULTISPECIES: xanthine dehydrogenase family protein molybdopterin-binding subunit [Ramlibacter]|uniref:Molybdopterin-dependent oxidoreductase n=1 Tax=Ramlibacter pinisoli TaxID=2682844 RepID=A0A6N8ITH6_9BURK|nr:MULTISPECIES: molybdopterin cofactor-binding domain-containing protein [Ramlibacter]MBA2965172.1 xanthine dehydrogenase family protein molybdopterin-binding subunit [Ramlibacter sp. CGMCC 1.13660]MVQ30137.1 molybdopterin-dependent oxidoreductase [Ramlibacter pinisoli]